MFNYDKKTGEIWLFDEITGPGQGGIDAGAVMEAVKAIGPKALTVRINSPGGSVPEGIAIFNILERHKQPVTTVNEALAASIANYIFMSGDSRLVAQNSLSMVHSPWTITMGNAKEMREAADLLDKAENVLRSTYILKMGKSANEIGAMMEAETWYTADEALQAAMATDIGSDHEQVAAFKIAASRFKNTPSSLKVDLAAGTKTPFFPKRTKYEALVKRTKAKYH